MDQVKPFIKTILLADDDEDDREFFHDALLAISAETALLTAENGLQALDLLKNTPEQPDLVFLDLNMPLKNGYDCLADIKQVENLKHLPVIIFSTSIQPEAVNHVFNNGASLYVVKPNSFPDLKNILQKVLAHNWKAAPHQSSRENFILQA